MGTCIFPIPTPKPLYYWHLWIGRGVGNEKNQKDTSANNKEVWEQNDGRYWNKIPFDIPYAHIANVFHYLHRDLLTNANNKGVWEQGLLTNAYNKGVWEQIDGRYWNKIPFSNSYAHIANVFHYLRHDLLTSAYNKRVLEQIDGRYWDNIPLDTSYARTANVSDYLHHDLLTSANNKGV